MERIEPLMLIENSKKTLRTADHLIYVTYSIIKEKRLLIKIFETLHSVTLDVVNAILQNEYSYKRIKIYNDIQVNFEIFTNSCAARYGILPEHLNFIAQILNLMKKHKESPMEFVRHEKYVIMSDNLHAESLTLDQLKMFLVIVKDLVRKAELGIRAQRSC